MDKKAQIAYIGISSGMDYVKLNLLLGTICLVIMLALLPLLKDVPIK